MISLLNNSMWCEAIAEIDVATAMIRNAGHHIAQNGNHAEAYF
jgi:hypothetical protein